MATVWKDDVTTGLNLHIPGPLGFPAMSVILLGVLAVVAFF